MFKKLCNSKLLYISQKPTTIPIFDYPQLSYKGIQKVSILSRNQFPHYKLTDIEQRGLVAYFTVCFLTAMAGPVYKYIGCSFRDYLLNRPIFTQFVLLQLKTNKKPIKFSNLEEMGLEDYNIREVHKAFELDEGILYDRVCWNLEGLGYAKLNSPEANQKRKLVINPNFASIQTIWGILDSNNSNVILGQQKVGKTFGIFTYSYLSRFVREQRQNSIESRAILDQIVDTKKYNLMGQFNIVPLDRQNIVQDYDQIVKRQRNFKYKDEQQTQQNGQQQQQYEQKAITKGYHSHTIVDSAQTYYDMYVKCPSHYQRMRKGKGNQVTQAQDGDAKIQRLKLQYSKFLRQLQSQRNAFCASRDINEGKSEQKWRQQQYGYGKYYRRDFKDPDKFDWFGFSGKDQSMDYFSFSHQLDGQIESYNIFFFQLSLRLIKKGVSKQKIKELQLKFIKIFKLPYKPDFEVQKLYQHVKQSKINRKQINLQQNWRIKVRQNVMNQFFNKHFQTVLNSIIANIEKSPEQLAISFRLLKHKLQFCAFLRMKRYYIDLVDQKGYSVIQGNARSIISQLQQKCKKSFGQKNNQNEEYSVQRQMKIQQFAHRLNEDQKYFHSKLDRYGSLTMQDNSQYFFTQNDPKQKKFSQNMINLIRITNFINYKARNDRQKQISLFALNKIYNRFWVNLFQQGHFTFKIDLIAKNLLKQQCFLTVNHTLDYLPMQNQYSIHNHFATIFELARQNQGETVGAYIIPPVQIQPFINVDLRSHGFDGLIVRKIKDSPQFEIVSLRWDGVNAVFEDIYYQQSADLQESMVDILSKIAIKETINWKHFVVVPRQDVTVKGQKPAEYIRYIFDKVLGVSQKYVNGHKLSIQLGEIDYQSEVPFFSSSSQTKNKDKYTNQYYKQAKSILQKIRKGQLIIKKEPFKRKNTRLLQKKREEIQVKSREIVDQQTSRKTIQTEQQNQNVSEPNQSLSQNEEQQQEQSQSKN